MARRVRAEAKSLRRCAWALSADGISRASVLRPQLTETELEVVPDRPTVDAAPAPPELPQAPPEPPSPGPAPELCAPEEPGTMDAADPPATTVLPLFAQAPPGAQMESVMVNAFAMVNPPPPWNALAECRQQAERLAELESEVLEECRARQDRLFRAELQEKQDEHEKRWKHCERDFEAQIALLERRVMETRLANQEAEMQMQQDARLRHQVVQERCNVLATKLAEEQAEFNTKHFQVEQTVSSLQAELLQSQKEMEAVKLQERSLSSCLHEELSAEARCAHFVAVEEESRKAQEALLGQQLQHREAMTSCQEQRFEMEERLHHSEHLQQMARHLSETEEEVAQRAQGHERQTQEKLQEVQLEKQDLASSVRVLTAEVQASQEQVSWEHEQWQMLKLEVKEARAKQEGLLVEVQAARDFATEATNRAEAEQRERLRDLRDFQRILRQHQERLDLQQRKEIWAELQKAVTGTNEELMDFEFPCDEQLEGLKPD